MSAASSPRSRVFSGTTIAPAEGRPSVATTHSRQLGAQTPTRSPGFTPAATAAAAHSRTSAASALKLRRRVGWLAPSGPRSAIASAFPYRCAAAWTSAGMLISAKLDPLDMPAPHLTTRQRWSVRCFAWGAGGAHVAQEVIRHVEGIAGRGLSGGGRRGGAGGDRRGG